VPKVEFEREGVVVEARAGQTLLEVAEEAGVEVFRGLWPELHCQKQRGWCRRCKVWVRDEGAPATMRLACQVEVRADLSVHTRSGGPAVRPSLETGAPAWKNALSNRKSES
jgi:ferredoxin